MQMSWRIYTADRRRATQDWHQVYMIKEKLLNCSWKNLFWRCGSISNKFIDISFNKHSVDINIFTFLLSIPVKRLKDDQQKEKVQKNLTDEIDSLTEKIKNKMMMDNQQKQSQKEKKEKQKELAEQMRNEPEEKKGKDRRMKNCRWL